MQGSVRQILDRYVGECDAGLAVLTAAINACVDLRHLHDGSWPFACRGPACELLWRAAHAQRASALLRLAAVLVRLEQNAEEMEKKTSKEMPEELMRLVRADLAMRKKMVQDVTAGTSRPHETLVLYQDVWRLSPTLTDRRFEDL